MRKTSKFITFLSLATIFVSCGSITSTNSSNSNSGPNVTSISSLDSDLSSSSNNINSSNSNSSSDTIFTSSLSLNLSSSINSESSHSSNLSEMSNNSTSYECPLKVGDKMNWSMIPEEEVKNYFRYYISYVFFEYKGYNHVIQLNASPEMTGIITNLHYYPVKNVTDDDFKKIKVGMLVHEVVELVGLPFDSQTSGLNSMMFKTTLGNIYTIYFVDVYDDIGSLQVGDFSIL